MVEDLYLHNFGLKYFTRFELNKPISASKYNQTLGWIKWALKSPQVNFNFGSMDLKEIELTNHYMLRNSTECATLAIRKKYWLYKSDELSSQDIGTVSILH